MPGNSAENLASMLIKNADHYTPQGFKKAHLLLKDGKIADILPVETGEEALRSLPDMPVYDAEGKIILPGAIDTHVHIREPGSPEKEDFLTGTAAALAGGITTICQMPNVSPMPHNPETLAVTKKAAEKALCNVAVYGSAGADNIADYAGLCEAGVIGLKTFLQPGKPGEPQYITVADNDGDKELRALLAEAARMNLRCFFHCEDYALIGSLEQAAHSSGAEEYAFHYKTRPDQAEVRAVERVLRAARETGAAVGIVHTSTVAAAEKIAEAKAAGQDVTMEICFHHLFFDDSYIDKFGPYAKCNPPLRSKENVSGLWRFITDGTADYLGSDHAPHLLSQKQAGEKQIWLAPSGIAHIEIMLPLMLSAVNRGRLTMERLAELVAVNGYKAMGLYPQKGRIEVGADADLTLVDLHKKWRFDSALMQTKAREACRFLDGLELCGAVEAAFVRGRLMYACGRVDYQSAGWGELLTPDR